MKKVGLVFRAFGASKRSLPHFIIAGVQKGGTTSLYAYLDQHPDMYLSRPKEVHFFDDQYEKGINYYRRHFPFESKKKQTGEASPYYIFHPHAPQRIKEHVPDAKIIVVFRNPIMRAYSHFHMQRRAGKEALETFEEAIAAEGERLKGERDKMISDPSYNSIPYKRYSYAARGMYHEQAVHLIKVFGKENVLFIKSENLLEAPKLELEKVYEFLGVPKTFPASLKKKHVGDYPSIKTETLNHLKEAYSEDQAKLTELLGDEFSWF